MNSQIYLILANLFYRPPTQDILDWLAEHSIEMTIDDPQLMDMAKADPFLQAWQKLSQTSKTALPQDIADEYQDLFIGIGRGEVVPYASWHLTGSLMETPLVHLRQDLKQLGFERQAQVAEPEDAIASLLEVMSFLYAQEEALLQMDCKPLDNKHQLVSQYQKKQADFFNRHLAPWVMSFTQAIHQAKSSHYYDFVADVLVALYHLEAPKFKAISTTEKILTDQIKIVDNS